MSAEDVLRELESALRDGFIVQLDYTAYDGFRAWIRRPPADFDEFYSHDALVDAIAERLENE